MLYDYPRYYEIAFSFRDIPAEVEFLHTCINTFSAIPVHRILEIACGPAPHTGELASRGYQYIGLDINRNMLTYAHHRWDGLEPKPTFLEGNMISFQLNQKVDFAFVMLGSLYINSSEELNSHFDSIGQVLKPGGLYFLDWCIQFLNPLDYKDRNTFSIQKDGITIKSKFDIQLLDPANHMYEETWIVDVNDKGKQKHFEMVEKNKSVLPEEFMEFINNRNDFEFVGWWRDWDLHQPIITPEHITRPVALVRRTVG